MDKKDFQSYRINCKRIKRLDEMILAEYEKDIPIQAGVVVGTEKDFPYLEKKYVVWMNDPVRTTKKSSRIEKLEEELEDTRKKMELVEEFIDKIEDPIDREILSMYFCDGDKKPSQEELAKKLYCDRSTISKKISKYL